MRQKHRHPVRRLSQLPANSSGFTLVEMLVAVTLVLLMMTMFASIFSMATDSVSKQRGISQNDQRARALVTVIRSDFQHRTNRYPFAFFPGEDSATSPTPFPNRGGYLYISTNDPYSGLDDLIQFTVNSDILIENTDDTPFFAKALMLSDRTFTTATSLSVNPNQPEADDGSLLINGTSSSNAAEISYFVRNGSLFRRVQLLRKPLPVAGQEFDDQPRTSRGYNLVSGLDDSANYDGQFWFDVNNNGTIDGGELSDDFWRHFDFSAVEENYGGQQRARFIGVGALSNEQESAGAANEALGNPRFRFGFNHRPGINVGLSREHTALGGLFLGRFTQAETSSSNFNWPQRPANVFGAPATILWNGNAVPGNPMDLRNTVTLNTQTGVVGEFSETAAGNGRGGPRRMEDLLLSNVHEMRIEIWDERLQKYTTPGHNEIIDLGGGNLVQGDYHVSRNLNSAYGPFGAASGGRVFDTWNPRVNIDFDNSGTVDLHETRPPYIAYKYYPPRLSDTPPGPSPDTMPGPRGSYWVLNTPYVLNDIVLAPPGPGQSFAMYYKCVAVTGAGNSGAIAPNFPTTPGRRIRDNEVEWESVDNRRPLSSIRMTLRFMDQSTDTQRQLSLIIPLTDKK